MKKFISLFKATTKGDMNIFRLKAFGKNNNMLIIIFSILMMIVAYSYANIFAEPLHEIGLTFVVLTIFSASVVFLNLIEGIYKAQGIIFDAKDNNLLFSMPIKKSYILTTRISKVLLFNYIFEALIMIPCVIRYVTLENTNFAFYPTTIIFLIVLPLIPLVISFIIGYLIKIISLRFKKQNLVQTVVTIIFVAGIMACSFGLQNIINTIASKANSINDFVSKLYLPIGIYIELIKEFNVVKLIQLILISVIPFILFILIFQLGYDKIINSTKEKRISKNNTVNNIKFKNTTVLSALVKKELKTYFSIPIYISNTIIGPILAIAFSVFIVFKFDTLLQLLQNEEIGLSINQINTYLPYIVIAVVTLLMTLSSITASSISLEGQKIELLKSIPVKCKDIFLSKILVSDIVLMPAMVIASIVYIIKLQIFNYNAIFIILTSILIPHLYAQIGLISNLKYPKLEFNSEIEVVKQGISVLITIMAGMLLGVGLCMSFIYVLEYIGALATTIIYTVILILLILLMNKILATYGVKKYNVLI